MHSPQAWAISQQRVQVTLQRVFVESAAQPGTTSAQLWGDLTQRVEALQLVTVQVLLYVEPESQLCGEEGGEKGGEKDDRSLEYGKIKKDRSVGVSKVWGERRLNILSERESREEEESSHKGESQLSHLWKSGCPEVNKMFKRSLKLQKNISETLRVSTSSMSDHLLLIIKRNPPPPPAQHCPDPLKYAALTGTSISLCCVPMQRINS